MTKTTGMTQGTPWTGVSTPRFRLQTQTNPIPATVTAATISKVMLSGGALSPRALRRVVRKIERSANSPTTATSRIQLRTGVMLPLTRSSTTLFEMLMTPPTAPLSTSNT
jgi:hypothetical protein